MGFVLYSGLSDYLRMVVPKTDFPTTLPGEKVREANIDRPCFPAPGCPTEQFFRDDKINPPDCSDHDIALWFTVIAHAL